MPDISGAMGIHQLLKADRFFDRRNEIANKYNDAFKDLEQITIPFVKRPEDKHAFHLYILKVPKRDEFIQKMSDKGVGTSVHFIPLHIQPYWQQKYNLQESDFPIAMDNFSQIMSLPIYTKLTDEEVERIINAVRETYEEIV
jgi:dTDP-4-amino-4,6-dideoxygalactose transaminase